MFSRVKVRTCAGQSSSSTPNSLIHIFMDLALCTGAQSCWNRKWPSPNCSYKVGSSGPQNALTPLCDFLLPTTSWLSCCCSQLTIRKDLPPLVTVAMSDKPRRSHTLPCSHAMKNTLWSREDTDKVLTDRTDQVTFDMKQSVNFQIWNFFKEM